MTLRDAADYIMKLPKAEQNLEAWQTAVEALIMAAEDRWTADARTHRHAEGSQWAVDAEMERELITRIFGVNLDAAIPS